MSCQSTEVTYTHTELGDILLGHIHSDSGCCSDSHSLVPILEVEVETIAFIRATATTKDEFMS
ncbi:MAG: hypothetical protein JKY54_02215 [Flavobacteriales bacterium]|nr:hypothetical protein [Flavobacteriales bacterium]